VVLQYFAMKYKKPFLLIIEIKYIHAFNILRLILWIFSKKTENITKWHILPCLCFGAMAISTYMNNLTIII
jgi:hypothetical protein